MAAPALPPRNPPFVAHRSRLCKRPRGFSWLAPALASEPCHAPTACKVISPVCFMMENSDKHREVRRKFDCFAKHRLFTVLIPIHPRLSPNFSWRSPRFWPNTHLTTRNSMPLLSTQTIYSETSKHPVGFIPTARRRCPAAAFIPEPIGWGSVSRRPVTEVEAWLCVPKSRPGTASAGA